MKYKNINVSELASSKRTYVPNSSSRFGRIKEKISRVLINLVENATKYGRTDGSIIASIYKTDELHVLVEISDDGIGIAEEHLLRVFERFYRTDRGRSRNVGGTGLGLSICKHIIEAHGQTIHARSTVDVGTSIGFTLDSKKD